MGVGRLFLLERPLHPACPATEHCYATTQYLPGGKGGYHNAVRYVQYLGYLSLPTTVHAWVFRACTKLSMTGMYEV